MGAKDLTREDLIEGILDLLVPKRDDASPYYDQNTSPLGKAKHVKFIRDGKIPGWKVGQDYFAKRDAVHAFIEAHPFKPKNQETPKVDESPVGHQSPVVNLMDRVKGL